MRGTGTNRSDIGQSDFLEHDLHGTCGYWRDDQSDVRVAGRDLCINMKNGAVAPDDGEGEVNRGLAELSLGTALDQRLNSSFLRPRGSIPCPLPVLE